MSQVHSGSCSFRRLKMPRTHLISPPLFRPPRPPAARLPCRAASDDQAPPPAPNPSSRSPAAAGGGRGFRPEPPRSAAGQNRRPPPQTAAAATTTTTATTTWTKTANHKRTFGSCMKTTTTSEQLPSSNPPAVKPLPPWCKTTTTLSICTCYPYLLHCTAVVYLGTTVLFYHSIWSICFGLVEE